MTSDYSLVQMVDQLSDYFATAEFQPTDYSDDFGDVRLPLYCVKLDDNDSIIEEIVVEIITEPVITKNIYLPDKTISGAKIKNASSVQFFRYYLPGAKVYFAFGDYVNQEDEGFIQFQTACAEIGIGLIEVAVNTNNVSIKLEAKSLEATTTKEIDNIISEKERRNISDQQFKHGLYDVIKDLQQEYIFRLVYYAEPRFSLRAITKMHDQHFSRFLINQLNQLTRLQYKNTLIRLSEEYFTSETRDDYEIALRTIQILWKERLHMEYPDIGKDFEPVLRLDKDYRDHFLHQFQVFLLGTLIIDRMYNAAWVKNFKKKYGSKLEDAWLAASTYHDFNYSIQTWEEWIVKFLSQNLHLEGSLSEFQVTTPELKKEVIRLDLEKVIIRNEFLHRIRRICQTLKMPLDDTIMRFILRQVTVKRNHAMLGALTFLERHQGGSDLTERTANQVAASIMLHDGPNWSCFSGRSENLSLPCVEENQLCEKALLPQISLKDYPLPFLLMYCDTAQEWGRKGRGYDTSKTELVEIQIDYAQEKVLINLLMEDDACLVEPSRDMQKIKQYLKADNFGIKISSRTGTNHEFWMKGNV